MNKSMTRINIISFFLILLFDTIALGLNVSLMYLCTLNIWFIRFLYAVSNLKKRSLLLMFLIAFFAFFLGGHFCYEFLGMSIAHYYSDEIYFHSNLCLFISPVTVLCSCWVSGHTFVKRTNKNNIEMLQSYNAVQKRIVDKELIRSVSKLFYYTTYIFWTYTLLDTISYVMMNSYYSYYTDYTSNAPSAIRAIAAMTPYFLLLATFPSKKQCRLPLALYNYLSGAGMGSCYIAELYHDAGYIGIILGNIIYGAIITKIQKIWNRTQKYSVWEIAICFAMVESFLKAPRWSFDIIFSYFLDLGMWMAFAVVYIVVKLKASVRGEGLETPDWKLLCIPSLLRGCA